MKFVGIAVMLALTLVCKGGGESENSKGLSECVVGLVSSCDIVTKYEHPLVYLESLKVRDASKILAGKARYQLARTLLDVHHLCQAISHQGYYVHPAQYPLLKLAETNFKGFERYKGEGGYYTGDWVKFFESNQVRWDSSSTFENQIQTEKKEEVPAATPSQ